MSNLESKNIYEKFKGATSSTPNNFSILSRKPIHPEESVSPIEKTTVSRKQINITPSKESTSEFLVEKIESELSSNNSHTNDTCSDSYDSYCLLNDSSKAEKLKDDSENIEKTLNRNIALPCIIMFIIGIVLLLVYNTNSEMDNHLSIKDLQIHFPLQSDELWNALESGIYEVKSLNKPSVFLFLHEEDAEDTVNNILSNASRYAECILNRNCEIQPIILTSSNLNTENAIADYGYIISKYKSELESRTVMIVKDLDKISGEAAQAFHSMCDEYTPLVEKTVFFFTMKINNLKDLQDRNIHVAEEVLRDNWNNLAEDIFEPLFTRISNIVLRIVAEKI